MATLEHAAIWTKRLEELRNFYIRYFGARSNEKYLNPAKQFQSYFLRFDGGARLEIMYRPDVGEKKMGYPDQQQLGIIHLAFGVDTMQEVDQKAADLRRDGFVILSGPRKTGDGYYEFETLDPDQNRLEVTTIFRE